MNSGGQFITGTDTGVGKTRFATALCIALALRGRRVAAMKPIASGCALTPDGLRNDDALALQAAANVTARYEDVNPYAFAPPIAPHIAAAEAGVAIDLTVMDRAFERLRARSDWVIVEGAGGWLAPMSAALSISDLAARWQLSVILVVGLKLGCLNHALLTAEAIERRGVKLSGWVGNGIDPHMQRFADNVQTLEMRIAAPCLGVFAYAPEMGPGALAPLIHGVG